jgi:hypothetical protein
MRLYVEPMDAVVTGVEPDGRVSYDGGTEGSPDAWSRPSLQERRAIIYAAQAEIAALTELLDILSAPESSR